MAPFSVDRYLRFCAASFRVLIRSSNVRLASFYCTSTEVRQEGNGDKKMEAVQGNPYFEKYADKIATLQKMAPKEFAARLERMSKRSSSRKSGATEDLCASSQAFTATESNKRTFPRAPATQASHLRQRAYTGTFLKACKAHLKYVKDWSSRLLDDVMRVDLIRDKSPEEISKIWHDHHQRQESMIAAVMPVGCYSTMFERSRRFSTFVYPVPRQQGFEFVLAQFYLHECHFTSLINYQVHKEDAHECLTIIHYPELEAEKGVVLMRGEYDKDVLTGMEAQCLVNQVQLYYNSKPDTERYRLLETFNINPNKFQHDDLINQLQNVEF